MRILGHKTEEMKGQWRRLNEEDLDLYSSPNTFGDQINKNEVSITCSMYGAEDNIKIVQEVGCG
jgi:hypothetical protein